MRGEIYLEIIPVDKALRVTAIDADSGLEVVFTAPNYTARERLEEVAANKLQARIERERAAQAESGAADAPPERGKLV